MASSGVLGTDHVLARDSFHRVRALVAGNPSRPSDALAILAKDTDSDVQKALNANPVLEIIAPLGR